MLVDIQSMTKTDRRAGNFLQSGAALLEFAVLLPLLVILLFGLVEFGRALLQENTLTKAVTTGARYLARMPNLMTPPPHCDPGTGWAAAVAQAEALIEKDNAGAGNVILPGLDGEGTITFDGAWRNEAVSVSGSTVYINVCVIEVEAVTPFVSMSGDSLVPFFQLGPVNLTARAEERYIGE
ncbi:MAG: TadE/TadG family type IV pilus assembly protein [Gammaproteobacteria bacterium]|nr:pilus assembly protein [Pseudomonadales bacterium]